MEIKPFKGKKMERKSHFVILFLLILTLFLTLSKHVIAQDNPLEKLSNLVGGKWVIDTQWENGGKFRQEYIYEWGLNEKIIKVKTFGTVNMETGEFGLRNEGIRTYDKRENKIKFWEFDVFGGMITGEVRIEENDIHFNYLYPVGGEIKEMVDLWEYVDVNKYRYKVRMKAGDKFKELLSTEVVRVN